MHFSLPHKPLLPEVDHVRVVAVASHRKRPHASDEEPDHASDGQTQNHDQRVVQDLPRNRRTSRIHAAALALVGQRCLATQLGHDVCAPSARRRVALVFGFVLADSAAGHPDAATAAAIAVPPRTVALISSSVYYFLAGPDLVAILIYSIAVRVPAVPLVAIKVALVTHALLDVRLFPSRPVGVLAQDAAPALQPIAIAVRVAPRLGAIAIPVPVALAVAAAREGGGCRLCIAILPVAGGLS